VVGVEGGREAVERARENAAANEIDQVEFHIADLTQPVKDWSWANRRYDKILLDPSRAGALEILSQVPLWQAARIVYISCNPSTLARDAGILVHQYGYRLIRTGVMDMFPHTAHVESIAVFENGSA
jgi:23S rRNA (uracil1939-C5)-methyltransferase